MKEENIKKFKLNTYKCFKGFININEEEPLKFGLETINSENYKHIFEDMEKFKKDDLRIKLTKMI